MDRAHLHGPDPWSGWTEIGAPIANVGDDNRQRRGLTASMSVPHIPRALAAPR
jgi:hypothetical protein